MPLQDFHPVIARWFADRLGEPTAPQRRGWEAIRAGMDTLIAAPTGSGKTLAAFLSPSTNCCARVSNGTLLRRDPRRLRLAAQGAERRHPAEPRRAAGAGSRRAARRAGLPAPEIRAAVRTGDTPAAERAAMLKPPPHILVTTPESLYLLLTARAQPRDAAAASRTVIVDEIHAVVERQARRAPGAVARAAGRTVGAAAAAAHRPLGDAAADRGRGARCWSAPARSRAAAMRSTSGHRRALDLALELPRLAARRGDVQRGVGRDLRPARRLIRAHRTTLVFVNTRRLAERVARHLAERLGEERGHGPPRQPVAGARGSTRETRLKDGPAQGAGGHRVAGAGHRHRRTSTSSARSARRAASPRSSSASAARVTRSAARRRAGSSRSRAMSWSSARRCCARCARARSTAGHPARSRSTSWRSRSSPSPPARTGREDELFALVRRA